MYRALPNYWHLLWRLVKRDRGDKSALLVKSLEKQTDKKKKTKQLFLDSGFVFSTVCIPIKVFSITKMFTKGANNCGGQLLKANVQNKNKIKWDRCLIVDIWRCDIRWSSLEGVSSAGALSCWAWSLLMQLIEDEKRMCVCSAAVV